MTLNLTQLILYANMSPAAAYLETVIRVIPFPLSQDEYSQFFQELHQQVSI